MEVRVVSLAVVLVLALFAGSACGASPYLNHTVGDNAGWFFDEATNKSSVDYSAWAAKQTFSLGDYLVFKTNGNSTVFGTTNSTVYSVCDVDGSSVEQFEGGGGQGKALVVEVPLTQVGENYYFSDSSDGAQCQKGMRFKIKVLQGNGLPPSLMQPPPPPYLPPVPSDSTPSVPSSPSSQQETFYRGAAGRRGIAWLSLLATMMIMVFVS